MNHLFRILVTFSLLGTINSFSQNICLYDSLGRLKVDNKLSIEKKIISQVERIEDHVLYYIYDSLQYPQLMLENNISGTVITEIVIAKKADSLCCNVVRTPSVHFNKAVCNAIMANKERLLYWITITDTIKFYIPFRFEIDKYHFLDKLEENKQIEIYRKTYYEPLWGN